MLSLGMALELQAKQAHRRMKITLKPVLESHGLASAGYWIDSSTVEMKTE
jgi:hypothetical protein